MTDDPHDDCMHWIWIKWQHVSDARTRKHDDHFVTEWPDEPPRDLGMFNCRGDYVYRK